MCPVYSRDEGKILNLTRRGRSWTKPCVAQFSNRPIDSYIKYLAWESMKSGERTCQAGMRFTQKSPLGEVLRHAKFHEDRPSGSGSVYFFHPPITVRRPPGARSLRDLSNWHPCGAQLLFPARTSPRSELLSASASNQRKHSCTCHPT